jgi:hypothetical protein
VYKGGKLDETMRMRMRMKMGKREEGAVME